MKKKLIENDKNSVKKKTRDMGKHNSNNVELFKLFISFQDVEMHNIRVW